MLRDVFILKWPTGYYIAIKHAYCLLAMSSFSTQLSHIICCVLVEKNWTGTV